ncbi:MAG TPA: hypothetical protein PLG94_14980 [Smithellaceae bacterium]|nr:hypothetical protein [Smithellaceae bacterium]
MKVIIAGGTGMIGSLILKHCLVSDPIHEVRSLVRKPTGLKHHKLTETVIQNFEVYSEHADLFSKSEVLTNFMATTGLHHSQVPPALLR